MWRDELTAAAENFLGRWLTGAALRSAKCRLHHDLRRKHAGHRIEADDQ